MYFSKEGVKTTCLFSLFPPQWYFYLCNKYCIRHLNFTKAAFDGLAIYVYSLLSGLVCIGVFVLVAVHNSHMLPWGNSLCVGWWWRGQRAVEWQFAAQPCPCAWPLRCCSVLSSVGSGLVCACLCSERVWAPLWSADWTADSPLLDDQELWVPGLGRGPLSRPSPRPARSLDAALGPVWPSDGHSPGCCVGSWETVGQKQTDPWPSDGVWGIKCFFPKLLSFEGICLAVAGNNKKSPHPSGCPLTWDMRAGLGPLARWWLFAEPQGSPDSGCAPTPTVASHLCPSPHPCSPLAQPPTTKTDTLSQANTKPTFYLFPLILKQRQITLEIKCRKLF